VSDPLPDVFIVVGFLLFVVGVSALLLFSRDLIVGWQDRVEQVHRVGVLMREPPVNPSMVTGFIPDPTPLPAAVERTAAVRVPQPGGAAGGAGAVRAGVRGGEGEVMVFSPHAQRFGASVIAAIGAVLCVSGAILCTYRAAREKTDVIARTARP